jgi:O-antigen ligase
VTIPYSPSAGNEGLAPAINSFLRSSVTFTLSAAASVAVTTNASAGASHPMRLALILLLLLGVHLLLVRKLLISRELKIYLAFIGYMFLSLFWTENVRLAMDTLTLAVICELIMLLFGALAAYHNHRAVFTGMLAGFLVAAAFYTRTTGFPFAYPDDFSYNTIAGMYLFGLVSTIMFGWFTRRVVLPIAISVVLLLLIAATTSIKTNLGIALGAGMAGLFYMRHFVKAMRKTMLLFIVFGVALFAYVQSNEDLMERINAGVERVTLGVNVLVAREDLSSGTALDDRKEWKDEGIKGWLQNPIVGNGVEGFRNDYGVTSHSTPVDLLYNSGVIGFAIFYATLLSIAWRLYRATDSAASGLRAFLFGLLVCYVFISLSSNMYYDVFLSVFVAMSAALLGTPRERQT